MKRYVNDRHEKFANALCELRISLGIGLREANEFFKESADYYEFENGKIEPLSVVLGDVPALVTCHRCQNTFERLPILNFPFPAYVCPNCVEKSQGEF